jgi:uncharacterized protein YycO
MMMMIVLLFLDGGNSIGGGSNNVFCFAFSVVPTTTTLTTTTAVKSTLFPSTSQRNTIQQSSRIVRTNTAFQKLTVPQYRKIRSSTLTSTCMVPSSMMAVAGAISGGLFAGGFHAIAGT